MVEQTSTGAPTDRVLTSRDVRASWLRWFLFAQASYSWERLQGTGFVLAMIPIIKRLWTTREEQVHALQRHLFFYNTEPTWGSVITGATAAMEEQAAQSAAGGGHAVLDNDAFNSVKTGLMGPLAGFGDTIDQGTITPILLALGISLAKAGTVMGPLLYMLLEGIWIVGVSYIMYMIGFSQGRTGIRSVLSSGLLDQVTEGARLLGGIVLGGLAATYIVLTTDVTLKVGVTSTPLQSGVLDKLLPGLLPLALVIGVWALLQRRVHPTWMMVILLAFGILGGITGWWQ